MTDTLIAVPLKLEELVDGPVQAAAHSVVVEEKVMFMVLCPTSQYRAPTRLAPFPLVHLNRYGRGAMSVLRGGERIQGDVSSRHPLGLPQMRACRCPGSPHLQMLLSEVYRNQSPD